MRKYSLLRLGNWRVGEVEEKGIQERRKGGRGKLRRRGYRKGEEEEEEEEEEGMEVQEKGRPRRRGVDRGREGGS